MANASPQQKAGGFFRGGRLFIAALGVLITLLMAGVYVWQPSFLVLLNHKTHDSLLRLVGPSPPSGRVAVVSVDDESLARYGQWPWPHYRLARLIAAIHDAGPLAVAVDYLLCEPDRTSLSIIRQEMARELGLQIVISGVGPEQLDNERALAAALAQGPSILGLKFVFDQAMSPSPADCAVTPLRVAFHTPAPAIPAAPAWPRAEGMVCNLPVLSEAAKGQGFLDQGLDNDGVLRRAPLLVECQGQLYPSLALATYLQLRGLNQVTLHRTDLGAEAVQVRENRIPVDAQARLLINYRDPAFGFKPISAKAILDGGAARNELAGKVVVVGLSAAGLEGSLATPLKPNANGGEIQATLLDNLIQQDYLSRPAYTPGLELLLVLLCGLVSTGLFLQVRPWGSLVVLVSGSLLLVGLSAWALGRHGFIWSPLWPLLTLLANFSLLNLARFGREERRLAKSRGELAQTVTSLREEVAERQRAEAARVRSEERFRLLSEHSPLGIGVLDPQGRMEYINPAFEAIFGYGLAEIPADAAWLQPPEPGPAPGEGGEEPDTGGSEAGLPEDTAVFDITSRDGVRKTVHARTVSIPHGKRFILFEDATARIRAEEEMRRLEEELYQSQKLEALGVLASGIAHDFNNVLQAISGYTQLMLGEREVQEPTKSRLEHIEQSIQRAALMIRRLMTLARKASPRRERVDLNWEIRQTVSLLEHTLPKMVMLRTSLAPDLDPISGDPGQIEQVLMNLATNAAHAMPQGGELSFATRNQTLSEPEAKALPELQPGPHVVIEVRDTGVGMDDETRSHIFEPFFTTKPLDMGTGLGLSTAFSIIAKHGGHIQCQSRPNQGTVFTIHLPVRAASAEPAPLVGQAVFGLPAGDEAILLVDDEPAILEAGREALAGAGYQVLVAGSGEQALEFYRADPGAIDLVVLDLNMPGMGGQACLEAILAENPLARVLIATGYSDEVVLERVCTLGAVGLISKPYRFSELVAKIRTLLDG